MSTPRLFGADVCLRCWTRCFIAPASSLHRPAQHCRFASTTVNSTTTAKKPRTRGAKKEKQPKEELTEGPEELLPKRAPRITQWKENLGSETLGNKASIIVLRDSEANRGPVVPRLSKLATMQIPARYVSPDHILELIDQNKDAPGQEEVNQHLDELRPKGYGQQPERPIVTSYEFQRILGEIDIGFNQLQLSRYITIHQSQAMLRKQEAATKTTHKQKGVILPRSVWLPAMPTPRQSAVPRGKKGLVNVIMRSIWGVEVYEEQEQVGAINVGLDEHSMAVLSARGAASVLQQLRSTSGAQIDLDQAQVLLRITASRTRSSQMVEEIEALLNDIKKTEFDLNPFQDCGRTRLSAKDILSAAEASGCVVEASVSNNSLLIYSHILADANDCRAYLVSAADLPNKITSTLIHSGNGEVAGNFGKLAGGETLGRFDRFHTPYTLGKNSSPSTPFSIPGTVLDISTKSEIEHFLGADTPDKLEALDTEQSVSEPGLVDLSMVEAEEATEFDDDHDSQWSEELGITYRAEVGQVLHDTANRAEYELTANHLTDQVHQEQTHIFAHESPGLPQLLLRSMPFANCATIDAMRLTLVPSPWSRDGLAGMKKYPEVDLALSLDRGTQTVQVDELSAIFEVRQVDVLLPKLATDVRFTKTVEVSMINAGKVPSIKSFLKKIEDSAAGYGKINAPPFLRLVVPVASLQGGRPNDSGSRLEVEYFVKSMRFEQSLRMEYAGYEMVIERNKSNERLSLRARHIAGSTTSEMDVVQGTSHKADFSRFAETVSTLLKALNEGVNNPRMAPLETEEAIGDTAKSSMTYSVGF